MKFHHNIKPVLLQRAVKVVVVGAGGTGSALLPRLMQIHFSMLALGHPGGLDLVVYDDDTVSPANIGRQGFLPCDIGMNKAIVLVNRLNMGWNTKWKAVPRRVDQSVRLDADVVIGCVDTRKARKAILESISAQHAYYLDGGNSENSGQVLIGEVGDVRVMADANRLPTVADLFPEMVNADLDAKDDMPSCSVADSLRKQSLVINMAIAVEMFNLLYMLFRHGKLTYSGKFINLESGVGSPIRIDTATWERMGYVAPKPKVEPANGGSAMTVQAAVEMADEVDAEEEED